MYKLIIAEDNKRIARHIASCIETALEKPIQITVAYDGETALHLMQEVRADIICTDIRMPIMEGMELINKSRKIKSDVRTVIISAYSDFDVAQKAIRLGVDDYLLKPLDDKELLRVIGGIIDELDKERVCKIREELRESFHGYQNGENWLQTQIKEYQIGILKTDAFEKKCAFSKRKIETWFLENYPNIIDYLVEISEFDFMVIVLWTGKERKLHVNGVLLHLFRKLSMEYPVLNMFISEVKEDAYNLIQTINEGINELKCRIIFEQSGIFYENKESIFIDFDEINTVTDVLNEKLNFILRLEKEEKVRTFFEQVFFYVREKKYPAVILKRIVLVLVEKIHSYRKYHMGEDVIESTDHILKSSHSYETLIEELMRLYTRKQEKSKATPQEIAKKIEDYIRKNLYCNLCLEDIAKYMKLSESYIVRIMKQQYGVPPIELFNQLRIEEAKRLLKEDAQMKIGYVSEVLHFSDQRYFSKVFKSYVGVTPSEYKEKMGDKKL